jgi:Protein of unknown function (DUF3500)
LSQPSKGAVVVLILGVRVNILTGCGTQARDFKVAGHRRIMRIKIVLASVFALTLAFGRADAGLRQFERKAGETSSSDRQARAVVEATTSFLASLSNDQRQKVQFAFTPQKLGTSAPFHRTAYGGVAPGVRLGDNRLALVDPDVGPGGPGGPAGPGQGPEGRQKGGPGGGAGMGPPGGFIGEQYGQAVWSNYPVSDVLRPGLRLGTLSPPQRSAAMHLLQSVLSPIGYQKVLEIMGSDQALTDAGTNFASGEAVYTIGIFGEPSARNPWMLEFGGHHLALNIVLAGPDGTMTPTLTGAQPSVYTHGGRTIRVLAQENDTAFALLDALTEKQKKQAVLNYEVRDLVLGPGQAGKQIQPEGLKASEMNAKQRAMLLNVIAQWAGIVNDAYAKARMAEIEADIDNT